MGKMAVYMKSLIELFHVGLIILDEIQLLTSAKKSFFEYLLQLTDTTGVSFFIVGTEEFLAELNKTHHNARRFLHLGAIKAAIDPQAYKTLQAIITQIWRYQWTKQRYPLTEGIVQTLVALSAGNIDLLTTIFVAAQLAVIKSEGTSTALHLSSQTINEAAKQFPFAKKLILEGKKRIDQQYLMERDTALKGRPS